ncbi:MAG: THxN family PEP-CTERM protein [Chromatocurvus sp.]
MDKQYKHLMKGGCIAFAAAISMASPLANAIPINITSIASQWLSTTPTSPDVSGQGSNTISWGTPAETEQSSYVFAPADASSTALNGLDPEIPFGLGEFTHNNFPITGTTLTGATLEVIIGFDVIDDSSGTVSRSITSLFDFAHLETPNEDDPCADGGALDEGVNENGCADRVSFTPNPFSDTFNVGGINYDFKLIGFCPTCPTSDDTVTLVDNFWTREGEANTAVLVAEYSATRIPLPGTAWLLLGGLAGFGAYRRRHASLRS